MSILHNYELVKQAIEESASLAEALDTLGIARSGDSFEHLKKYCKQYDIPLPIYANTKSRKRKELSEILVFGIRYTSSKLLKRLVLEGIKQYRCEGKDCPNPEPTWAGESLTLQLEHINGDHCDNRIENLSILCPNCHSQTNTWGNKGRRKIKESKYCQCGKQILQTSTSCQKCQNKVIPPSFKQHQQEIISWPEANEILLRITNGESYTNISKELNVSDNAIRKYLKRNGITPPRKHK